MTKKKEFKKAPGPKLKPRDRVRVQLAENLRERYPDMTLYNALRIACLIYPEGLPKPLPDVLKDAPRGKYMELKKFLGRDNVLMLNEEANRLSKAIAKDHTWIVDTSTIEGSPDYDSDVVRYNELLDETWDDDE